MSKKKQAITETQQGEPPSVHQEDCDVIKHLLFSQVDRPKNLHEVRITNVYDNRYRINVWVEMEEDGITKRKIGASHFAKYDGETLEILI